MTPNFSQFQCPQCGWWPDPHDEADLLQSWSNVVTDPDAEERYGITNALTWTETWQCPHDKTIFSFRNANF